MKIHLTTKQLSIASLGFFITYIAGKVLDELFSTEKLNIMIHLIIKNLFAITVFATIFSLFIIKIIEYYKSKKEIKELEKTKESKKLFKEKTLLKYALYKTNKSGIFIPTNNGNISADIYHFRDNFSDEEIKIINDEKLIHWKIEFLL